MPVTLDYTMIKVFIEKSWYLGKVIRQLWEYFIDQKGVSQKCQSTKISVRYKYHITRYVRNISMCTLQATIQHAMLRFYVVADKGGYHIERVFSSLNE